MTGALVKAEELVSVALLLHVKRVVRVLYHRLVFDYLRLLLELLLNLLEALVLCNVRLYFVFCFICPLFVLALLHACVALNLLSKQFALLLLLTSYQSLHHLPLADDLVVEGVLLLQCEQCVLFL